MRFLPKDLLRFSTLIIVFSVLCSVIYTLTFDFLPNTYNFVFKSASVFLFIFLILSNNIKNKSFVVLALCASGVGDIFLTFLGEKYFLLGLSSFFVAHVGYIITFYKALPRSLSRNPPYGVAHRSCTATGVMYTWLFAPCLADFWTGFKGSMGRLQKTTIAGFVIFAMCMVLLLNSHLPSLLKIPTYLYICIITLMVSLATCLRPFPTVIFWGALSFAISDSLLSISTFVTPFAGNAYAVWFFYYTAQFLIVNGIINFNRSAELSALSLQTQN